LSCKADVQTDSTHSNFRHEVTLHCLDLLLHTSLNTRQRNSTRPQELRITCINQLIEQFRHTLSAAAFTGKAGAGRVQAAVFRAVRV